MTGKWEEIPLSAVFSLDNRKLGSHDVEPRVLSLSKYDGLVPSDEYFEKRIASEKLDGYKSVEPGGWAYSTIHIDEGSIARNTLGFMGVISPMYTTMRWIGEKHDPAFFELLLRSPQMLDAYRDNAQGSVNRRRSLPFKAFASLSVAVPSLSAQRRIVDLMAHLDSHLENLKAEIEAGAQLEARFLERLLGSAESVQMLNLGDVGEFIRGRRFTKADYVPSGLGCIHYGQVHTHFGPIATEVLTYIPVEMQPRMRLARAGDVVIAATSEDLSGLGKATAWLGDSDVAVHDDCYIFRHSLDPKYATYALASPWFQSQKAQFGDGMKVTRISSSDLARIQIPVPPRETQIRIGEAMASLTSKSEAMRAEVSSLSTLRQCLLSLLLSGQVQIPTGFDELLAEVS